MAEWRQMSAGDLGRAIASSCLATITSPSPTSQSASHTSRPCSSRSAVANPFAAAPSASQ